MLLFLAYLCAFRSWLNGDKSSKSAKRLRNWGILILSHFCGAAMQRCILKPIHNETKYDLIWFPFLEDKNTTFWLLSLFIVKPSWICHICWVKQIPFFDVSRVSGPTIMQQHRFCSSLIFFYSISHNLLSLFILCS